MLQGTFRNICTLQSSKVKLEKKCLYIQEYMSTMVVLLADSGLHLEHNTLNQLVRRMQYS